MDRTEAIKMKEYDADGNIVEYDVIMIYDSDITDKRYVFYTDGKKTASGSTIIRAGYVDEKEGKPVIIPVSNPIEQQMLSQIYTENIEKKIQGE